MTEPQPAVTYHTRTWLLWMVAAGGAAGVIRNPFYLVIVLLAARLVDAAGAAGAADGRADPRRQSWGAFLRLGGIIGLFSAGFNFLAAHVGTHVLVRLPADWPLVGGPLTLEGLAYGLLNGLALVTLIAVFGTFSAGVDTYALLRNIPAGFAQAGLVTAIALAYIPQTLTRLSEIREAQTLRGHRLRGVRDLLPLAVPLLTGGLDRAITLAEAMEARGFAPEQVMAPDEPGGGGAPDARAGQVVRVLLIAGAALVLLGGALLAYLRTQPWWGGGLLGGGALAVGGALARLGRSGRTRYRREVWRRWDTAVSVALLAGVAGVVGAAWLAPGAWTYTPYLTLAWPPFDPLLGLALLLLAAPAVPTLVMSDER